MPEAIKQAADKFEPAIWLGKRIARFGTLTSHPQFPVIYGKLAAGIAPQRIALWLQQQLPPDDPLGSGTVKPDSLTRRLQRFKRCLPAGVFEAQSIIDARYGHMTASLDSLSLMDEVVLLQRDRVGRFIDTEKAFPLEQIRREVQLLGDLIQQRVGIEVSIKTGIPILPQHTNIDARQQTLTVQLPPADNVREFVRQEPGKLTGVIQLLDALDDASRSPEG